MTTFFVMGHNFPLPIIEVCSFLSTILFENLVYRSSWIQSGDDRLGISLVLLESYGYFSSKTEINASEYMKPNCMQISCLHADIFHRTYREWEQSGNFRQRTQLPGPWWHTKLAVARILGSSCFSQSYKTISENCSIKFFRILEEEVPLTEDQKLSQLECCNKVVNFRAVPWPLPLNLNLLLRWKHRADAPQTKLTDEMVS